MNIIESVLSQIKGYVLNNVFVSSQEFSFTAIINGIYSKVKVLRRFMRDRIVINFSHQSRQFPADIDNISVVSRM